MLPEPAAGIIRSGPLEGVRMRLLTFSLLFAFGVATPVAAQIAPAAEEEIVVTAPSRELVQQFVGEITAQPTGRTLARWDTGFCAGVVGMHRPHAQFIIDRISETAIRLGLEPGESGCRPNVLIFMSEDADTVARELAEDPRVKSPRNRYGNSRGCEALIAFAETPRPVRWWHLSRSVTGDGFEVARGNQVTVREMGRVRGTIRQDLSAAFVVIDASRVRGVPIGALADYVTMVTLAQLDPEAQVEGLPTILNLFSPADAASRPSGLTEWDMRYLDGLYNAIRTARDAARQEEEIARRMRR